MAAQQMDSALPHIIGAKLRILAQLSFDSERSLLKIRHPQSRGELDSARRQRDFGPAAEWVREARTVYDYIALPRAVYANRLLEGVRGEPVIKDSRARSEYGFAIFKRRPGEAQARSKIVTVVKVGLRLVAQPDAHRQAFF